MLQALSCRVVLCLCALGAVVGFSLTESSSSSSAMVQVANMIQVATVQVRGASTNNETLSDGGCLPDHPEIRPDINQTAGSDGKC